MVGRTAPTRGNLPAELSSFIGRRRELQEVKAALSAARLVTLVGPGWCWQDPPGAPIRDRPASGHCGRGVDGRAGRPSGCRAGRQGGHDRARAPR